MRIYQNAADETPPSGWKVVPGLRCPNNHAGYDCVSFVTDNNVQGEPQYFYRNKWCGSGYGRPECANDFGMPRGGDGLELRKRNLDGLSPGDQRNLLENMTFLIKKKLGSGTGRNYGGQVVCEIRHAWDTNKWISAYQENTSLCRPDSIGLGFVRNSYSQSAKNKAAFVFIERPGSGTAVVQQQQQQQVSGNNNSTNTGYGGNIDPIGSQIGQDMYQPINNFRP